MSQQKDSEGPIHLKLCLLGDGRVGKTSLRRQYLGQGFPSEYLETLGADFSIKTINFKQKHEVRYQIWDIAGQPKFNQIRKSFYMGAQAALVLYDITQKSSLSNLTSWLDELYSSNGKGVNIPVVIIGNKIDLREDSIAFLTHNDGLEKVNNLKNEFGIKNNILFLETSAKTGENVNEAFNQLTEMFLKMHNILI